jgi:hypothetical protein|tara:strand:+ start:18116 stop:19915 length:1800 start_codon:yes stop_codon:yes gene_type:complete
MRLINWRKQNWMFLGALGFLAALNYLYLSPLESLPSPIYGGDYYYQLGQTSHFKFGGSPLDSATLLGALPGYFVLYTLGAGLIAKLGFDVIAAHFIFSYLVLLLGGVIFYNLVNKLFNSKILGVVGVLVFFMADKFPILKYTPFAEMLIMPLVMLLLFNFLKDTSKRNSIILGIGYGLAGLAHSISFIGSTLLIFSAFLWYSLRSKGNLKSKLMPYVIVAVVGGLISMAYWAGPIFIHQGQTSLNYNEWNNPDWSDSGFQFEFVKTVIVGGLFSFGNVSIAFVSLFTLLGLIGLFLHKKSKEFGTESYLKFLLASGLIITLHYLVTTNLFGIHFIPDRMNTMLMLPVWSLLFVYGVRFGFRFSKSFKLTRTQCVSLVVLALLVFQVSAYSVKSNGQWYQGARNELPIHVVGASDYLIGTGDVNDVILTTKELGFSINAFSGRKLISVRRAQNDPFIDMDSREIDHAIILYGTDDVVRRNLLEKYSVDYLYWDQYWFQSEYTFDNSGKVVGSFDPLIVFDSEENRRILNKNGVQYFPQHTWVDPALRGDEYRTFDLLLISPGNYRSFSTPWSSGLDKYLTEVWRYDGEGNVLGKIYKVKL